jgi:hypothetical protein
MNAMAWTYVAYLGITIGITIWVARTLQHYGVVLMTRTDPVNSDAPSQTHSLAEAMSHLLVIGFYLVNLGVISFALKSTEVVTNPQTAIELLSTKVGMILVVLGGMHFLILAAFASYGKNTEPRPRFHRERPLEVTEFIEPTSEA